MIAYKGFEKDLVCRGYQFTKDKVHETDQANCRENGFHCAENPLDCLYYYRDWKNSVYYLVEASGDLDEDGADTKISCTRLRLLKELDFKGFCFTVWRIWKNTQNVPGTNMYKKKPGPVTTALPLYGERLRPPEEKNRMFYCF